MSSPRARPFARRGGGGSAPGRGALPSPAELAERLADSRPLDPAVTALSSAIRKATRSPGVADALHGVWLGQPAHPALTDMPVGFWAGAAVLDFLPGTRRACKALIALGLAGAAPAALTGLADWAVLHREQQRVGAAHAVASACASALFGASLLARLAGRHSGGRLLALGGLTALGAGAYLGRHLAFALAAGASHADQIAHLAPLGWHDLCRLYELPEGRLVSRRLGYLTLAVLRQGSEVLAVADRCSHLAGPLHQGALAASQDGPCVTCPWHGSTFAMSDGTVLRGPATARQPAFETRVAEGQVVQVRPAGPRP